MKSSCKRRWGISTRLREMSGQLEAILTNPTHAGIYWAQVRAQDGAISLHMAPLRVAPLLQKSLFARKKCAILTSATLCSAEGFDYIRERLGLEDANESKVGSPFDYKASTLHLCADRHPGAGAAQLSAGGRARARADVCRHQGARPGALYLQQPVAEHLSRHQPLSWRRRASSFTPRGWTARAARSWRISRARRNRCSWARAAFGRAWTWWARR